MTTTQATENSNFITEQELVETMKGARKIGDWQTELFCRNLLRRSGYFAR